MAAAASTFYLKHMTLAADTQSLNSNRRAASALVIPEEVADETKFDVAELDAAIRKDHSMIRINVGGRSYMARRSTLYSRCKTSRLGRLAAANECDRRYFADDYFDESNEFYFDRTANSFDCVYRFYCSGVLHRPVGVCSQEYLDELDYWEIPDECAAKCCILQSQIPEEEEEPIDLFMNLRFASVRRRLWHKFEGDGSWQSNIFIGLSNFFVVVSIAALIIGSLQDLMVEMRIEKFNAVTNETETKVVLKQHMAFDYIETICIIWFTAEFITRFAVAPEKCVFMKTFLNIVDLSTIVPFFFDLFLMLAGVDAEKLDDVKGAFLVIRVLRVLRVMRVFKFGRYSAGLRTFAATVVRSARQLLMMLMVMAVGILFFGTIIYYMEKQDDDSSQFKDIPAAFWWCIVTMTTVGYGDIVPVTPLGKAVASCAIMCGVLVIALPITIIVDNYMKVSGKSL